MPGSTAVSVSEPATRPVVPEAATNQAVVEDADIEAQLLPRSEPGHAAQVRSTKGFFHANRRSVGLWASGALCLIGFIAVSVLWAPGYLAGSPPNPSDLGQMTASDRVAALINYSNAKNQIRTTLLQAIAGAAFFTTAFFAWRQITVTRAGQLTDRFTKSIEQLGQTSSAVRLGGVYALEQLGADERFSRQVAHVLVAFIRQLSAATPHATTATPDVAVPGATTAAAVPAPRRAPAPRASAPPYGTEGAGGTPVVQASEQQRPSRVAPYELREAALIVASRGLWRRAVGTPLDLSNAFLCGVDLSKANLSQADLRGADLRHADLREADLTEADLRGALLNGAHLEYAILTKAWFRGAHLDQAHLTRAHGVEVRFAGALMTGAEAGMSEFTYSDFSDAVLNGLKADGRAKFTGSVFYGAKLRNADLTNADLSYAHFENADITGVDWTRTTRTGAIGLPG